MPTFNADEVFEMAEQIERNGAIFYRRAAEQFGQSPSLRELLLSLAGMEDQHERTFARIRGSLFGDKDPQSHAEYEDLASAYLHALVKNKIFLLDGSPEQLLGPISTPSELLRAAIDREKETILYYVGIKEAVRADFGKESIDQIIREEMSHVTLLSDELAQLER